MKIIYPRLTVLILLFPMLIIVGILLSYLIFKIPNLLFIMSFSSIIYIYGIYSYAIIIVKGQIHAKDTIFQFKKDKINIIDINQIKIDIVRNGESYLKLIGEDCTVSIYRTYFSKNQVSKLRKLIEVYKHSKEIISK